MSITPMQKLITQRTDRNGFCGEKVTTTFTVRCWAESTDKINKATKERYKKILISDVKDVVLQECGFTLGHFEAMQAAIDKFCTHWDKAVLREVEDFNHIFAFRSKK